jgi:uncharacterized protein involved in tolerance to divalent cations
MEQNREPRNQSVYLWTTNFEEDAENTLWEKDSLFNKRC